MLRNSNKIFFFPYSIYKLHLWTGKHVSNLMYIKGCNGSPAALKLGKKSSKEFKCSNKTKGRVKNKINMIFQPRCTKR